MGEANFYYFTCLKLLFVINHAIIETCHLKRVVVETKAGVVVNLQKEAKEVAKATDRKRAPRVAVPAAPKRTSKAALPSKSDTFSAKNTRRSWKRWKNSTPVRNSTKWPRSTVKTRPNKAAIWDG